MADEITQEWGFYGRAIEQAELEKIISSGRWFFCAISGRRRIGKTTLIQRAMAARPDLVGRIERVVVMGGAIGGAIKAAASARPPEDDPAEALKDDPLAATPDGSEQDCRRRCKHFDHGSRAGRHTIYALLPPEGPGSRGSRVLLADAGERTTPHP